MSSYLWEKSPTPALSLLTRWSSVILAMASTWPVACCTVVMLSPRMSMLLSQPSRPNAPSSLWTGAQLVSRWVYSSPQQTKTLILVLRLNPRPIPAIHLMFYLFLMLIVLESVQIIKKFKSPLIFSNAFLSIHPFCVQGKWIV